MKNNNARYGAIVAVTLALFFISAAPHAILVAVSQIADSQTRGQSTTENMAAVIDAQSQVATVTTTDTSGSQALSLTSQLINLASDSQGPSSKIATKNPASAASSAALSVLVNARETVLLNLAKTNPNLFLESVLPDATRNALPKALQSAVEQKNTVTGTLRIFHSDDFKNEANDVWDYYIDQPGGGTVQLYPTSELSAVSGTQVTVNGYSLGNIVVARNDEPHIALGPTPPLDSVGLQHVLVLLIQYPGAGAEPFTPQQVHDFIFNGQFEKYYEEQSYGKISFVGDVTNWISVSEPAYNFCYGGQGQVPNLTDSDIQNYLSQNNIDISKYNRIVYLMDHPVITGGCSVVGENTNVINGRTYRYSESWIGDVSSDNVPLTDQSQNRMIPFDWNYLDFVLSHEMGHALGLMHSNGWDCDGQILYGDCQHIEYGNWFDVMGQGAYALDFVAFYKNLLGWLDPNQVLTITKSGDYSVKALELPNANSATSNNVVLAQINNPVTGAPYLAIDHRVGTGFDAALNNTGTSNPFVNMTLNELGIFVGTIQPGSPQTERLLNMKPTVVYWNPEQPTLNSGSTFTDLDNGIALTTDPVTSTSTPGPDDINFHVQFSSPQCVRYQPISTYTNGPTSVNTGKAFDIAFSLINQDSSSCSDATFTYSISGLPSGATYSVQSGTDPVVPGVTIYPSISVTLPSNPVQNYLSFIVHASDSVSGLTGDIPFNIVTLPPLTVTQIVPSSAKAGQSIVITGTGFPTSNGGDGGVGNINVSFFNDDDNILIKKR